jgi:cysteine synthase
MPKAELDKLREDIFKQYLKNGGSHQLEDFNTHLPNYDELIFIIKEYLNAFQEKNNIQILIDGTQLAHIAPGKTFLKHLFYTKKNEETAQFQRINVNLCYMYAYGKTREELRMATKQKEHKDNQQNIDLQLNKPAFTLSFTYNNLNEARKIETYLKQTLKVKVENDIRNSPMFNKGSISELFSRLKENEYVIILISRDYLQNENSVAHLIDFAKNNADTYQKKAINLLLPDVYDGEYNIFSTLGKIALSVHWKLHIEKLEKAFSQIVEITNDEQNNKDEALKDISEKIDRIKTIKRDIFDMLQLITGMKSTIRFDVFFHKIAGFDDLLHFIPAKIQLEQNKEFENIYHSIQVPSNNNPNKPEFPPAPYYLPKFPASTTTEIKIPGFKNVWLKDESSNPTGTHKDRFAWEVVIKYKALLESLKYKKLKELPQISMISSGGAATAVQNLFNIFDIPVSLKVLIDKNTNKNIIDSLKKIGCTIYETDLSLKLLKPEDIKQYTDNSNGIDITYRETMDPNMDNYYDWLSYEILNEQAAYCFIPFGTGDLFINILNIVKKEYFNSFLHNPDPRFAGSVAKLKACHFMAATTHYKNTRLDKLYSSFLPTYSEYENFIDELKSCTCVGDQTNIYNIEERFVESAIKIAQNQQITFEPSGLAGIALLLQMQDELPRDKKILIVNTGKTKQAETLMKEIELIKKHKSK